MARKMMKDGYIGENIARLRSICGLSQEALAARLQTFGCDMTRATIAKLEGGRRNIFAHELPFFRMALDVTYEELLEKR